MTEELRTLPLISFFFFFLLVNVLNSNYHSVQEHQTAKDEMLRTVRSVTLAQCDTRVTLTLHEKEYRRSCGGDEGCVH